METTTTRMEGLMEELAVLLMEDNKEDDRRRVVGNPPNININADFTSPTINVGVILAGDSNTSNTSTTVNDDQLGFAGGFQFDDDYEIMHQNLLNNDNINLDNDINLLDYQYLFSGDHCHNQLDADGFDQSDEILSLFLNNDDDVDRDGQFLSQLLVDHQPDQSIITPELQQQQQQMQQIQQNDEEESQQQKEYLLIPEQQEEQERHQHELDDHEEEQEEEDKEEEEEEEDELLLVDKYSTKNLVSERNRRKRLSQQLFALRSIVPNITKMDRRSILVDALAYLKSILHQTQIEEERISLSSSPPPPLSHRHSSSSNDEASSLLTTITDINEGQPTIQTEPPVVPYECPFAALLPAISKMEVEMLVEERFLLKIEFNKALGAVGKIQRTIEMLGLDIINVSISNLDQHNLESSCFLRVKRKGVTMNEESLLRRVRVVAKQLGLLLPSDS